ncbi:MAG: WbqC family protein [Candidatus Limisoma sp.]
MPLPGSYYQIWQARHGFISSLSILDLLFNVGREAVIFLSNK